MEKKSDNTHQKTLPGDRPFPGISLGTTLLLFASSLALACILTGGPSDIFSIPLRYNGDALFHMGQIKRLLSGSWVYDSASLGWPFGADALDYPMPDSASFLALKLLATAFGDITPAYNLFYLLGFPFAALAAFAVLRHIDVSIPWSFTGAMLYAFLPFHFLRGHHLLLTWYFVVPVYFYYAFRLFQADPQLFSKRAPVMERAKHFSGLLFLSCFAVYYSFFGVILLFGSALTATVYYKNRKPMLTGLIAVIIVCSGVGLNLLPNLIHKLDHGENPEAVVRAPLESEIYGLKIIQLLLPRRSHRLQPLAELNRYYSSQAPLVTENATSSLGTFGSAGFLVLICYGLFHAATDKRKDILVLLSAMNLLFLLTATIGGFSSAFAMVVTPNIRGWNRASVFIAFLSISALTVLLDRGLKKCQSNSPRTFLTWSVASIVLILGLLDQTTSADKSHQSRIRDAFNGDKAFIERIEENAGRHGSIYQLPYMPFPEHGALYSLPDYDLLKGYLHSRTLSWSYGGMKGRDGDLFFRKISLLPLSRQIEVTQALGFSGIYVDRRGFTDQAERELTELSRLLGKAPDVTSADNHVVFYAYNNAADNSGRITSLSAEEVLAYAHSLLDESLGSRNRIDFSEPNWPLFVKRVDGVSYREHWGRWSDANLAPSVRIRFERPLPDTFHVTLSAYAFGPNVGKEFTISVGNETRSFTLPSTPATIRFRFRLTATADTIEIRPPEPTSPWSLGLSGDSRKLGIALTDIIITVPSAGGPSG